jgi:hypothetical protein
MATSTITIRLPEETIEKLQRLAESQGKSASVLGRDMIVAALECNETSTDANQNALVIEYLQGFGGVLMALTHETVAARYFAEMATNYATDMESLLRERKVMEPEAKAALMKQFEAAALKVGQETWNRVLGLEQKHRES